MWRGTAYVFVVSFVARCARVFRVVAVESLDCHLTTIDYHLTLTLESSFFKRKRKEKKKELKIEALFLHFHFLMLVSQCKGIYD